MSLIQYQQATYAVQLRDQLEMAGCDTRVAAVFSRAIGDLIDHVSRAECDMRRDIKESERLASMRSSDVNTIKRNLFCSFIGATVLVLTVAVVSAVHIALSR